MDRHVFITSVKLWPEWMSGQDYAVPVSVKKKRQHGRAAMLIISLYLTILPRTSGLSLKDGQGISAAKPHRSGEENEEKRDRIAVRLTVYLSIGVSVRCVRQREKEYPSVCVPVYLFMSV